VQDIITVLLNILTDYGVDSFMAASLVFIVIRFDHRLNLRDEEARQQRRELIDIVENNTRAMTGLQVIVETICRRNV
jgi:hypothetical protein